MISHYFPKVMARAALYLASGPAQQPARGGGANFSLPPPPGNGGGKSLLD